MDTFVWHWIGFPRETHRLLLIKTTLPPMALAPILPLLLL